MAQDLYIQNEASSSESLALKAEWDSKRVTLMGIHLSLRGVPGFASMYFRLLYLEPLKDTKFNLRLSHPCIALTHPCLETPIYTFMNDPR